MANSKRREKYTDRNGNMLIPVNVEGGQYKENFITTPKLAVMALLLLALFFVIYRMVTMPFGIINFVIWVGGYIFIAQLVIRYVIFEEKFYYKMYKEMKLHEIDTPALFWNIASIKDTDEGAIMTYSDAKIGIMVKVERDTITGKEPNFKETHYDAISDFYKEIMRLGYKFIQMNIMEPAGKDPRLMELSKVIYKSDNKNIVNLMELEVGHIKNITRSSLYVSDYFLFYTEDMHKVDVIINDISEAMYKLLDGAYVSYNVLNSKDLVEFNKEEFGVTYFNATEASLSMYSNNINYNIVPFNITGIVWDDDYEQTLNQMEKSKLRNITSGVINETIKTDGISLKKTLYRKEERNKVGIDFSSLDSGGNNVKRKPLIGNIKPIKKDNINNNEIKEDTVTTVETTNNNSTNSDDEFIDF